MNDSYKLMILFTHSLVVLCKRTFLKEELYLLFQLGYDFSPYSGL